MAAVKRIFGRRTVGEHILVAGIPGSGKTTYCRWLEQEKDFLHLDFDELLEGRGTPVKLALVHRLCSVEEIAHAVSELQQPIAMDWGFPVASMSLVQLFKVNRIAVWWLDVDRDAARQSFIQRGTVSLEAFDAQMKSIEDHWPHIAEVVEDNVIQAVSAGPTHATPEYMYRRMFGR